MDTTNISVIDTLAAQAENSLQLAEKDPNPFGIFVMGVAGVFVFVLLYMVITKTSAVIIKKLDKNKSKEEKRNE